METHLEQALRLINMDERNAAIKMLNAHKRETLGLLEDIEKGLGTVTSSASLSLPVQVSACGRGIFILKSKSLLQVEKENTMRLQGWQV